MTEGEEFQNALDALVEVYREQRLSDEAIIGALRSKARAMYDGEE